MEGESGRCTPSSLLWFYALYSKYFYLLGNPYLKILDLSKRVVADAHMKRKKKLLSPTEHFDIWL